MNPDVEPMSEAELRAAPPQEYMSPRQLAFFEQRLRAMHEELLVRQAATLRTLERQDAPRDPMDRATLEEQRFVELRLREREAQLLRKVEAALRRIRDGEYGYCERSGEPLGIARLLARPTATRAVRAERRTRVQA